MPPRWDGGRPVSARGRFYVEIPAGATTALSEETGGAAGDELDWLWLFPADVTPGSVTLADGANVIWTWPGGITLNDTRPIFVPLNLASRDGPWTVTTPADMTALAAGAFA